MHILCPRVCVCVCVCWPVNEEYAHEHLLCSLPSILRIFVFIHLSQNVTKVVAYLLRICSKVNSKGGVLLLKLTRASESTCPCHPHLKNSYQPVFHG